MLSLCYKKILRTHLRESQYLALRLLMLLLQSNRQLQRARLARMLLQPIHYRSRIRNLLRFLVLPQLSVHLL